MSVDDPATNMTALDIMTAVKPLVIRASEANGLHQAMGCRVYPVDTNVFIRITDNPFLVGSLDWEYFTAAEA